MPQDDTPHQLRHAQGTTGRPPEAGLARDLSELACQMQAEPDMASVLDRIVQSALTEIDGAAWAGITVVEQREVHTEAASDQLVTEIDEQQYRLQEGPCLTSLHEQETVRSDDLRSERRFPRFAAVALEHGVRSMLCVQPFVEADNLGALNLYAPAPNAFDEHAAGRPKWIWASVRA